MWPRHIFAGRKLHAALDKRNAPVHVLHAVAGPCHDVDVGVVPHVDDDGRLYDVRFQVSKRVVMHRRPDVWLFNHSHEPNKKAAG